jgi:hypothetical protein
MQSAIAFFVVWRKGAIALSDNQGDRPSKKEELR